MKSFPLFLLLGFCLPLWGQNSDAGQDEKPLQVAATWPGISMVITGIQRIQSNRLLVIVNIAAAQNAPQGTLLGIAPPPLPANATKEEKMALRIPKAFSIQDSTMTDEKTGQKFQTMSPLPFGPRYPGSAMMIELTPGQDVCLTIQFPIPPPPPPDSSGKVPKQTVSILLPKAKGPITGVVVPPPDAPVAAP